MVTGSRIGIDKAVPTTDLDISGSVFITGSLSMNSGGITGSLFGTSSQANTASVAISASTATSATSASFATTASFASSIDGFVNFPNGLSITGSLVVSGSITGSLLGTASLATSASFSTTSSFASTAQTLLGSVTSASYAATASLLLGSVVSASYALSASYAPGGSGLTGGTTNFIPVWTSATAQSSSVIYQSSSRNIIIGDTTTKHPTNPPLLEINNASGETEALHLHGQVNNSYQFNIKNYTSGTSASADILVIADAGTPSVNNYVALGVNSSAHSDSGSVGNALDAYLYNTGSDLLIGNISPDKRIIFFNGGNRAEDNARVYIDATGSVGINTAITTAGNPEALVVRAIASSYNLIRGEANIDSYAQINIVNLSGANSASADIVATANNGNESVNFIDMGINSDQYTLVNVVGAANDAYLYSTGNDLLIGNATAAKNVVLFAGGPNATTNQKLVLAANNTHNLSGSLQVSGAVTASLTGSLTGALIGTSSWAVSSSRATTSSFAISSSYALSSSYAMTSSRTVSASYALTASVAALATTASYFAGYALFSNGLDVSGSLVVTGSLLVTGSLFGTSASMVLVEPPTDNTGAVGTAGKTWANGQFTNLSIDSTLTVRAAIDLADSDVLRMGSSDDWQIFYNGTTNEANV